MREKTRCLTSSRRKRQKVEYGVTLVSRMLEAIAMARGTEASLASSGEEGAFVFGVG